MIKRIDEGEMRRSVVETKYGVIQGQNIQFQHLEGREEEGCVFEGVGG